MSEPFIGEIRMFAATFAPRGWANCDGQLLSTSQNDALFSLFGTQYGGDGVSTFGLPDLRGRVPIHAGTGPGLTTRSIGNSLGQETTTLAAEHVTHRHRVRANRQPATDSVPQGNVLAQPDIDAFAADTFPVTAMSAEALSDAGGSQAHSNMQPFLCIRFIVALVGVYPSS